MESREKVFFKEAEKKLKLAKEEIFKPEEDLLSYSICKNSQFAIENFLMGFLTKKQVKIDSDDTIESLYKKCLKADPDFKTIDLKAISCRGHAIDSRYCTSLDTVKACFDVADTIETYLMKTKVL